MLEPDIYLFISFVVTRQISSVSTIVMTRTSLSAIHLVGTRVKRGETVGGNLEYHRKEGMMDRGRITYFCPHWVLRLS